jgi:hypothetical protein
MSLFVCVCVFLGDVCMNTLEQNGVSSNGSN